MLARQAARRRAAATPRSPLRTLHDRKVMLEEVCKRNLGRSRVRMLLRHRADWRTLLWAFVAFPLAGFAPYVWPRVIPWMLPLTLYLGFCAGVFSHNQNHCPTFKSRKINAFYAAWLSIFYLCPTYVWIPSHNLNHHKYVN